jgi:poly-gamma-glutamate capsule biosynthesis protein CapA/YwtB (metallophosphatase superfamily)
MDKKVIRVTFVGDILLHSDYDRIAAEKGPFFVFEKCSSLLKSADVTFGNLECVLSGKGVPNPEKGCLRGDGRYIESLGAAGFSVLSLANNHTFDFGLDAYEDMAAHLESAGIRLVGAGRDLEQSRRLNTFCVNGVRVGFLAYSARDNQGYNYASQSRPGVAPLEEEYVLQDIERYKDSVNHLIVSLHWGIEYSPHPTPHQISLAHRIIDAGAHIIVGHHPRILQGYEYYKNGVIFYSVGSFCHSRLHLVGPGKTYTSDLRLCEREVAVIEMQLSPDRIDKITVVPFWLNEHGQPEPCEEAKAEEIMKKIAGRSSILKTPEFEQYWESLIIKKRVWGPILTWWGKDNIWAKIRNFKLSQLYTLWILLADYLSARFSKRPAKWLLFSTRNDRKARPQCGNENDE